MDEGCTQPLSSDPMIHLNTMVFFLIADVLFVRNLHKFEPLTFTILITMKTTRVREGVETYARARVTATTRTQVKKQAHKHSAGSSQLIKCSNLKHNYLDACLWSLGVFGCSMEVFVCCSMRIRVPFIAVGSPFGRQFLPSVRWRTGQSGAPPDMNSARLLSFFGEVDH
jgi:hypothetical protein